MRKKPFFKTDQCAGNWGQQLACPVCGNEYVHFEQPNMKTSDDYDAWEGRGSAIRIPMWCESGHNWDLRIGFHKGNSFMDTENHHETKQVVFEKDE